ncbi:MAG: thioredoxin domain-containing protein [Actinomycetota bacterium]
MPNRLLDQTSPYLRQHADNPVDWFPWGEEAFELARSTDRPLLLSVGYSSCHWCHVMAHESFENVATAELMNQWFVNIKVDREERPDVDRIYMEATQAMTGHGGWPMTVFATPDGRPFFCGTYFPDRPRGGQASFAQVLTAVHEAWADRRDELLEQAGQLTELVRRDAVPSGNDLPGVEVLDEATLAALASFDAAWGGFGQAPKFPQTLTLDHLLRTHVRTGSTAALDAVVTSVDAMSAGGIHDHLGGGFSRYSVDRQWLVPHFEKMLYDNALLIRLLTHTWQVTGAERHLQTLTEAITYVLRDLSHSAGGRFSAEDADSLAEPGSEHAEEGEYYLWTPEQVAEALESQGLGAHTEACCSFFDITSAGNFEGRSIPNRIRHRTDLDRPAEITEARRALASVRSQRPRPGLDDKVLCEWNALMITALAEAGAATGNREWVIQAELTALFLCERLRRDDGRWLRSWQSAGGAGRAQHLAYAADHGALLDAFLALYQATGLLRWLDEATAVAEQIAEHYWDPDGGVFTTADDAEELLTRPRELADEATPSGASQTAVGFLRLEALTGETRYGEMARSLLRSLGPLAARHPTGFGMLLWAVELDAVGITEVVITGERPDLVAAVHRRFLPTVVLAAGERSDDPLWEGRDETGSDGRAYVCRNRACRSPVDDVEGLLAELG